MIPLVLAIALKNIEDYPCLEVRNPKPRRQTWCVPVSIRGPLAGVTT